MDAGVGKAMQNDILPQALKESIIFFPILRQHRGFIDKWHIALLVYDPAAHHGLIMGIKVIDQSLLPAPGEDHIQVEFADIAAIRKVLPHIFKTALPAGGRAYVDTFADYMKIQGKLTQVLFQLPARKYTLVENDYRFIDTSFQ